MPFVSSSDCDIILFAEGGCVELEIQFVCDELGIRFECGANIAAAWVEALPGATGGEKEVVAVAWAVEGLVEVFAMPVAISSICDNILLTERG